MENEKEMLETIKKEVIATIEKSKEEFASKEDMANVLEAVKSVSSKEDVEQIKKDVEEMALQVKASRESHKENTKSLKDLISENSEVLKSIRKNKANTNKGFTLEVTKATAVASNIGSRDYLGQIEAGIEKLPVRKTSVLDLFAVDSVSSEYMHYWEEASVTRDAKFVIACATSTHTTGKTWAKRTIELAKVRDMTDICIDMLEDYDFVESELRALVFESIQLKKEAELLLGVGTASTDLLSIDTISSEFNPSNVLSPFNGANGFQDPNIEQLIDAMSAQIYTFGAENKWMSNTVIMNYTDFVRFRNLKDSDGNKIVNIFGDSTTIAGHRVITSPLVAPNTLYVLDSTKGRIKQRKGYTATLSYENKDNIEHELATLVAYERLQFHVRLINRNAFMKCSNIATAIGLIAQP